MLTIDATRAPRGVAPPDIVWDGLRGDFQIAADGGLRGGQALASAVAMLLMTDAPCEPSELKREMNGDFRGWPGDGFDIDTSAAEGPLGSKLWLYRRHELVTETGRKIEDEVKRALNPLVVQKACARVDCRALVNAARGRIELTINLFGKDGASVYARKFDDLWSALDGVSSPLAG